MSKKEEVQDLTSSKKWLGFRDLLVATVCRMGLLSKWSETGKKS